MSEEIPRIINEATEIAQSYATESVGRDAHLNAAMKKIDKAARRAWTITFKSNPNRDPLDAEQRWFDKNV